ncbi:MAG: DEAD/DEAH box helicase [Butyrivibrio sp.]|nr:DEAD/DEAH box helicase [Butyrivibrio sp.]
MPKPNFDNMKKLVGAVMTMNAAFDEMYENRKLQEDSIRSLCQLIAAEAAKENLKAFSVDELKNAKAGIRVPALQEAGFNTLGDIAMAKDYQIQAIEGIGEKQTESIRNIITEFANSISKNTAVRLFVENPPSEDSYNSKLITELSRYMMSESIRSEAEKAREGLRSFAEGIVNDRFVTSGFKWFFSGSSMKQHTLYVEDQLYSFCNSAFFNRVLNLHEQYQNAIRTAPADAMHSFSVSAADFYAVLERLGTVSGNRPFVYDSIPKQLADEVLEFPLDLHGFMGNLRAYQSFGAKYILSRKKVLLGDEMGLGKTIQAIAAMAHLDETSEGTNHFLVVCPASVLVNWDRELHKFTHLSTFILHGPAITDALISWKNTGGVAITNYESMGKIVDSIDNHMHLSLLVIDEAHYIKNPDAQRTKYIRRLDNESERILMMTGTPLENKVEEMCSLVEFVRPDMVETMRNMAHLSNLPEFKETLSPLYLRRKRDQVLTELPPIDEKNEWCDMTKSDREAYVKAVSEQNFATMRRVSFLQDDLGTSSKAQRLLELCNEARDEARKVVIFSFFRETIAKLGSILSDRCSGIISGDTKIELRQSIIDEFSDAPDGSVLLCQIQAGGVGLNIQAASIVIFCEPQIKPSLTWQALSRVYRMGQVRNVLVYHLLCPGTVDDAMMHLLEEKKIEFNNFAEESAVAEAFDTIIDKDWIHRIIEAENQKYLPAPVPDT